jgi:alpha-glucosidase
LGSLLAAITSASAQITTLASDTASSYGSTGFTGNNGFGFGAWTVNTPGGGKYISNDTPPDFGIWNTSGNSASTAVRTFNSSLSAGETFSVQLMMNNLDSSANINALELLDASGNVLFAYWHQGGENADGHYTDAGITNGTASGFAFDYQLLDSFAFTLVDSTHYTFSDLSTGASISGMVSGAVSQVEFLRANQSATPPSNGQDFKFNTLAITAPGQAAAGAGLAYEGFDYPPGAVTSQSGGYGWGDVWTNVAGNAMYFDLGSLIGESNAPVGYDAHSQGNHLSGYGGSRVGRLLDCSPNGVFAENGYLNANSDIGAAGKTVYVSFLQQPAVTSSFYEFEFHRGDYGDPGRIAGIGNDTAPGDTYLRTPSGSFFSLGRGDTAVNFYVVRIDFHGGNDDIRIYRNPTSITEPATPTLTRLSIGDLSFDRLCVGAWGNYVATDEIRVGSAWTNVTGLDSAAIGSVQPVAVTNATMIGQGIAQFVPDGFDSNQAPSLSLISEPVSTGPLSAGWSLFPTVTLVDSNACASLAVPTGTSLYGGGEVAGPLLRNGQTVDIWNTDTAGWSTDNLRRMYQAHPWVLGVRPDGTAFGVLFDSSYKASLTTGTNRIVFQTHGPLFRIFVIDRASPQAVLQGLAQLTGTMPMPPEWALGYHQCRFSYSPASQVQNIAMGFLTNQIPCDAIWMDIGYMKNNRDFTIDPVNFPSMPSLTSWLHANGFHAVNILDPAIAVDSNYSVYQSGTANNVWVQTANGQPYQAVSTPGNSSWPDFTMPTARSWWSGLCGNFMTNGMDGLWIDMDEPSANNALTALNTMPYDNWHRGGAGLPAGSHLKYHNAYGLFESLATYQGELAAHPNRRPFVLTRANFIGGQRYAATWTGDNVSSTNDMYVSVPMSLTLGLSGQPFSGPDLGGFIANATPDLWGNWVGFGAFLPFCRGHSTIGTDPKEPWAFGATVKNAAQIALQRRYRLLPYLYTLFYNSSQTGVPVMQPVFFANPADLSLRAEQQAFLLGSDLLVVPAWAQNPALPKGIWQPLSLIPGDSGEYQAELKIRGGAIIPAGAVGQNTSQNLFNPLTLIVCLDANGFASGSLYRDAGDGWDFQSGNYCLQTFTAQQTGNTVNVQLSGQQGTYPVANTPVNVEIVTSNGTFYAKGAIDSGITVSVSDEPALAQAAFDAYNAAFLVQTNGSTYYKRSLTNNSYAGSWVQALEIQLAEDAYDRTQSLESKQLVQNLTSTFLTKENYDWSLDTWNDDIAWMTIACVRGYQITGNAALFNKATNAWNMAYNRGWDSALGGGIWEEMNARDAKCALSNDPMIVAGGVLYQITGQSAYLTKCQSIYAWVRNNIFNPTNGQVYEGIHSNGAVMISDNVYNSGAFINAANCLHNLTGATNYYADALLAASHVINNNAILSNTGRGDSTWQDQFARGLANFARDNGLWGLYNSWMTANANAAWNSRRADLNITWNSWTTQTTTNDCSSLECLSAAVIQQVIPAVTPAAPVFTLQPSNQIGAVGNAIGLNAVATNGQPITYQWYHENNPIPGAVGTNLVLVSLVNSDVGHYWVVASNSVAGAFSQVANVYLIGNTNGTLAYDSATNYDPSLGLLGNQGFGFGPWVLNTVGGGGYLSGDAPPLFGLWNSAANGQSTAARTFNVPLPIGGSFTVQLEMTSLDTAFNQNGFSLQDASGNTLFNYWHQGGDNANGHYTDANGNGTAAGFAFDFGQLDSFKFTLTSATNYTFADLKTAKSFSGKLSGGTINGVTFFRINGAAAPSNGQDFKFSNLAMGVIPATPSPSSITAGEIPQGLSLHFPVAPGYSYRLQRATNLTGPWMDIGTLTGPGTGMAQFIDTNPPAAGSFYRTVTP